jgi:cytochrome c-type biogenesis protein CcmH
LSGATSVIVGARISKSGNAMPQSGDLQGLVSGVAVGTSGLKVEISSEVTK